MNGVQKILKVIRQPLRHPEFIGIGGLLGALSLLGIVLTLISTDSISSIPENGYFQSSILGLIIAYFLLRLSKIGTLLFVGFVFPYAYHIHHHYEWPADARAIISQTLLFSYSYVVGCYRQIKYHIKQRNLKNNAE